jgi:hypothetical protein
MGHIKYKQTSKLKVMEDIDIDKIINEAKNPTIYHPRQTHIDFEVLKLKDLIIKQLQEEVKNLKEEIEDLKTDLKSMIEIES